MALQGTIKDFGLADIFQLIGIQRKTGILTLDNGLDAVTVKFVDGNVVGSDTRTSSVEERLGHVLVRSGRITPEQLDSALRAQKKTLQRLGHVLVKSGAIQPEDLIEALRVQSLQIVYRLFRWQDGKYHFQSSDRVEYDEQHFEPISSETILMEGARMIDEWPIIRRRIKSDEMVLRPTEAALKLQVGIDGMDRDIPPAAAAADPTAPTLSPGELEVIRLVDGSRTVEEITDNSTLGEFDTHRILMELLTRHLVEEVKRPIILAVRRSGAGQKVARRFLGWTLAVVVFALAASGLATLANNPLTPWRIVQQDPATANLTHYASQARLATLNRALEVFYLDAAAYPADLSPLALNGYVRVEDLLDPWGRRYGYELGSDGYRLFGFDAGGEPAPELVFNHNFGPAERMVLGGGLGGQAPSGQ